MISDLARAEEFLGGGRRLGDIYFRFELQVEIKFAKKYNWTYIFPSTKTETKFGFDRGNY